MPDLLDLSAHRSSLIPALLLKSATEEIVIPLEKKNVVTIGTAIRFVASSAQESVDDSRLWRPDKVN